MPRRKDLKHLTRARMDKTGESYTTARAQLLRKKAAAEQQPAVKEYAALAGMGDDRVREKTGRTWKQWVDALDAVDAMGWKHGDIVAHLSSEYDVPGWWSQMVTVGYERIRGLREIGQRRDGTREISRSRTVPVPIGTLYRAWSDTRKRKKWLPDAGITVRKANPEKIVRLRWADGTPVEVYFVPKGEAKSQIAVAHRGLVSEKQADAIKALWQDRLNALVALLG